MKVQTISIVVPTYGCVNKCKFCVSKMHQDNYVSKFDSFQITKRIKWATMNGVNTCIITGTGEALQNKRFLVELLSVFNKLDHPFPNVELQTSGVLLMDRMSSDAFPNINLLKKLGVNTISLSVSDIFDDENNVDIIGISEKLKFKLEDLCKFIKENGFNLRLSLNMLYTYEYHNPDEIISRCKELGANQITFRKMYASKIVSTESNYVKNNACSNLFLARIQDFIEGTRYAYTFFTSPDDVKKMTNDSLNDRFGSGKFLYELPFGASVFSINGMSVVIDKDCMSKCEEKNLKYVILRENGKLYSQWDDEGSLIF